MTEWPAKPVSSGSSQSKDSDAVPRRQQEHWGCSLLLTTIPTGLTKSNKQNNKQEFLVYSSKCAAINHQDFGSHQFPFSDEAPLLFTAFALVLPHLQLSYPHLKLHRIQRSVQGPDQCTAGNWRVRDSGTSTAPKAWHGAVSGQV